MEKEVIELSAKLVKAVAFPISFDECLRFLMPHKKRPEDRFKIFRDYIRDSIRFSAYMKQDGGWSGKPYESTPIPTDDEVSTIINKQKADGFSEDHYSNTRMFFTKWLADYESKKLSDRAKKGAAAKWKNKGSNDGQTKEA